MTQATQIDPDIVRTVKFLGGKATIGKRVENSLEVRDLLMVGLPASALMHLAKEVGVSASSQALAKAIGISAGTLRRRKKGDKTTLLNAEQSHRTWKFAEVLGCAAEIFGSKKEAEAWMNRPAIGLDQCKPIDLLATPAGFEVVTSYLGRIKYGVYT